MSSLHQVGRDFQSIVGGSVSPFKLKRAMKEKPSILYGPKDKGPKRGNGAG
jgi:hypothetical protein